MMPSHGTDKAFFNAIDVIEHLGKNTANRRRESDNLMNKSMKNNDKEVDQQSEIGEKNSKDDQSQKGEELLHCEDSHIEN